MIRPNVDQLDRDQLDDLGLVPDTDTADDLRPRKNAPGRCANTAEGQPNHHQVTTTEGAL